MKMNDEYAHPRSIDRRIRGNAITHFPGMILRDHFAGQAMQAIISASHQSEESSPNN